MVRAHHRQQQRQGCPVDARPLPRFLVTHDHDSVSAAGENGHGARYVSADDAQEPLYVITVVKMSTLEERYLKLGIGAFLPEAQGLRIDTIITVSAQRHDGDVQTRKPMTVVPIRRVMIGSDRGPHQFA